jgi:dTMP kinase
MSWLITLEGGEGAGKTSVMAALQATLEAAGHRVVRTREPGGTPAGEAIRGVLLDRQYALHPHAELLLMFASRAQLCAELVEPAIARGEVVLSDRFTDASFAYQGGGRGIPSQVVAALERQFVTRRPDFTLLLDVDVATGLGRARSRGGEPDRIELERETFFEQVRAAYRTRAAAEPDRIAVIDAGQPQAAVVESACAALLHFIESRGG